MADYPTKFDCRVYLSNIDKNLVNSYGKSLFHPKPTGENWKIKWQEDIENVLRVDKEWLGEKIMHKKETTLKILMWIYLSSYITRFF